MIGGLQYLGRCENLKLMFAVSPSVAPLPAAQMKFQHREPRYQPSTLALALRIALSKEKMVHSELALRFHDYLILYFLNQL